MISKKPKQERKQTNGKRKFEQEIIWEEAEKRPKVTIHGLKNAEKITISQECYIRVYEYTKEHPSFQLQDVIVYALYVYYKMLLEM